jgi:hypothetical protein
MKFKNRHHRKPRSIGGSEEGFNISIIEERQHKAWHLLFRNMTPQQIADKINGIFLDTDFKLKVVKRAKGKHLHRMGGPLKIDKTIT